jgi:hypothetical protein
MWNIASPGKYDSFWFRLKGVVSPFRKNPMRKTYVNNFSERPMNAFSGFLATEESSSSDSQSYFA